MLVPSSDTTSPGDHSRPADVAAPVPAADRSRPDLRLLLPAAAAWLTSSVSAHRPDVVLAVLLLALATLLLLLRRLPAAVRARALAVCAGVLVCAFAAYVATVARATAARAGPLDGLARARATVTVDLTVTGDPHPVAGRVVGAQRVADATVLDARADRLTAAPGYAVRLRRPLLVFAPPGGWATRLPGERLRVTGRLRLALRPGGAPVFQPDGPPVRLRAAPYPERLAARLRAGLRTAAGVLPYDARGLLPGLVVGDTSRLDDGLRDDFRRTGLTHLVAVSGQNVAIFLAALLLVARRTGLGPRAAAILGAAGLAFFVVVARPSPSVLRAATTGWLGILGTVTGRERAALRSLAASVLLLVLLDPALARSISFALSVAATTGLLVLGPPWRRRLARHLPGWAADAVATPLAAQVACAPLLAAAFGQVSLVAIPANVAAAPAVPPATVAGVTAAALAPVCMPLARLAAWLAGVPTGWLVHVARAGARLPAGQLGVPTGLAGAVVAVVAFAAVAVVLRRRTGRYVTAIAAAVVLLSGLLVENVVPGWPLAAWRLVACDVGQGDALAVRSSRGAVLVDTGPDPAAVDGCLHDLGIRRVAAVVLTHFHADHVEGLPGVLRGRRPREVVVGPLDEPPDERARVLRWTASRHIPVRVAALGEQWRVGDAAFDVLGPESAFHGTDSDPNNSSLVLRLTTPGLVVLLTGDVEEPAQLAVLARGPVGHADVLKVAHHGSARQTAEFIDATGAAAAIVSVGRDNPYGHPAPSTIDALTQRGMRTYRTDRDGDVGVARTHGRLHVVARRGRGTPPSAPGTSPRATPAALRAISWRRAAEPGSWCPVRTGSSPAPPPTAIPRGRAPASATARAATGAPAHAAARDPPSGLVPAPPIRTLTARIRARRDILPPCPPQPPR